MTMNDKDMESACTTDDQDRTGFLWRVQKNICNRQLLRTVAMGQGLAVVTCGTAITSQYLATHFHVNAPMFQSFLAYALLGLTYTTMLIFKTGNGNILQILRNKWWKYLLLSLVDVEANYTVVKAYQYTTLTSIQLLDCFTIPVLMLLSWVFLKTRYRALHYVSVCVCLLGVGAMVGADLMAGRDQGSTSNILLGDGLVLISSALYAVSNVCQEYTVKNLSREEFLGMVGLFGTLISGIQLSIVEYKDVASIQWGWEIGLLLAGYALCLYVLYSCMPIVVKMTSATSVNLSLLTADLFSLFCGLFLFQYTFSGLYMVSLVVILAGFISYHAMPTTLADPADPEGSEEEESYDNPTSVCDDSSMKQEVGVERASDDEEDEEAEEEERFRGLPGLPWTTGGGGEGGGGEHYIQQSTKM